MFVDLGMQKPTEPDDEQVSVVLRRRIPINKNDNCRSWLGGLPQMPSAMKWPRDKERSPLHFVAQVCCADLPDDLWGGIGPRSGWLLLFVHAEKLEDEARDGMLKVLHIEELGPETLPPNSLDPVRNQKREHRGGRGRKPDPRETKAWRKWPVDLVVQRYRKSEIDWVYEGPPASGPELYGAPDCDRSLSAHGAIAFNRPIRWRGALDVVEGLIRNLDRATGSFGGLKGPPEPDRDAFDEEVKRRMKAHPQYAHLELKYGGEYWDAKKKIGDEVALEHREGWIPRSLEMLSREEHRTQNQLAEHLAELKTAEALGDDKEIKELKDRLPYYELLVREKAEHRDYLTELFAPFPGPDGEAAFTAQIEASAAAHIAWSERQAEMITRLHQQILAKDPDAFLPEEEWDKIVATLGENGSAYWHATDGTDVLRKREVSLDYQHCLDEVLREEVLDLYSLGEIERAGLSAEALEDLECKLRRFIDGRAHRMGGHRNPVQHENLAYDDELLLFQITSDDALGWVWADLGALYVSIEEKDLRKCRFNNLLGWLEGG